MADRYLKYDNKLLSLNGNLVKVDVTTVSKVAEEKTVTPSTTQQTVTPTDSDHELSKVTVNAIQTETKTVTTNGDVTPSTGKFLSKVTVNVPTTEAPTGAISITENGTHDVTNYASANVNVQPTLQEKTATPTTTAQEITADSSYDGLSKVTVGAVETQTKTATPTTEQQEVTPDSGKFLSSVTVNAIQTETKTVTPSTSSQDITPTSGKFLSKVTVKAIPSQYITTGDATAYASDLIEGKTAYARGQMMTGTYKVGTKTITANGEYTATEDSLNAYGSVTVSVPIARLKDLLGQWKYTFTNGYRTLTLNDDYSAVIEINSDGETTTGNYTYTFDGLKVVVDLSGSSMTFKVGEENNETILTYGTITYYKLATTSEVVTEDITLTPTTSQQVVNRSSGKYINSVTVGAVTNSIDSNITAENIKSGVTILGVTGTLETTTSGISVSDNINTLAEWSNFVGTWEMVLSTMSSSYKLIVGETTGDVTFALVSSGTVNNLSITSYSLTNGILTIEATVDDGTQTFSFGISSVNYNVMFMTNLFDQGYIYPFVKKELSISYDQTTGTLTINGGE